MIFGDPPTVFAYHLGFHFTGEAQLGVSLAQDRDRLAEIGVSVPRHRRFAKFLEGSMNRYRGNPVPVEDQMELYDLVNTSLRTHRVVISNAEMLCPKKRIFDHDIIYAKAAYRSTWIRGLFPNNPCEFHLSVCNPIHFLKHYFENVENQPLTPDDLVGVDFSSFWDAVVGRIRYRNPDCPIFLSRAEDHADLWRDVLASICNVESSFRFAGATDVLVGQISELGAYEVENEIASNPNMEPDDYLELFAWAKAHFPPKTQKPALPEFEAAIAEDVAEAYKEDLMKLRERPDVFLIE